LASQPPANANADVTAAWMRLATTSGTSPWKTLVPAQLTRKPTTSATPALAVTLLSMGALMSAPFRWW
jgi:hypothetical protein